MYILQTFLAVTVLAIAPVALLQGLSAAKVAPGPVDWNGFWQADLSRAYMNAEEANGQISLNVADQGIKLARDAWLKEPLASDALSVLAADLRQSSGGDQFVKLLRLASSLDKRNRFVGALQLDLALQSRDIPRTFALIERLSLTSPRLKSEFVAPLPALLAEEGGVRIIRGALASEPVWATDFWYRVPGNPRVVSRMYELRRQIDFGATADTDARLMKALVDNAFYSEAIDFWKILEGQRAHPLAFLDAETFPPIGWRVVSTGERSLSPRDAGRYDVYVERETAGELATQLVQLQPGSYDFSADVARPEDGESIDVSLQCATSGENEPFVSSLAERPAWEIDGSCEIYWLTISGTARDRARPLRTTISNLSFKRSN